MFLPPVVVDINDLAVAGSVENSAIPARMATVLIVIAPIISELVLQISHGPKAEIFGPALPGSRIVEHVAESWTIDITFTGGEANNLTRVSIHGYHYPVAF
jgi:hypothetical protein